MVKRKRMESRRAKNAENKFVFIIGQKSVNRIEYFFHLFAFDFRCQFNQFDWVYTLCFCIFFFIESVFFILSFWLRPREKLYKKQQCLDRSYLHAIHLFFSVNFPSFLSLSSSESSRRDWHRHIDNANGRETEEKKDTMCNCKFTFHFCFFFLAWHVRWTILSNDIFCMYAFSIRNMFVPLDKQNEIKTLLSAWSQTNETFIQSRENREKRTTSNGKREKCWIKKTKREKWTPYLSVVTWARTNIGYHHQYQMLNG